MNVDEEGKLSLTGWGYRERGDEKLKWYECRPLRLSRAYAAGFMRFEGSWRYVSRCFCCG